MHYVDEYLEVSADFENMTREIVWKDNPIDMTNEAVLRKSTDYYGNTVYHAYFGMFGGSSIDEYGNVTYGVDNFIEYEVLDAFGTIWLYAE